MIINTDTETKQGIKNTASCIKYTEDKKALKTFLKKHEFSYTILSPRKYFKNDKEERNVLDVEVRNKKTNNKINFQIGLSIRDTFYLQEKSYEEINPFGKWEKRQEIIKKRGEVITNFLYTILSTICTESYCPENFQDFCDEYGYNKDSIRDLELYKKSKALSEKLNNFFDEEEIEKIYIS